MTNGHGPTLDAMTLSETIDYVFAHNQELEDEGMHPTPICIWGSHGIGKTQLIRDYALSRGWKFAYCAPAQFEEMGDLHGLPTMADPGSIDERYTIFAPPDWVPKRKDGGPGILLIDDLNRADDRILRGIMQLLQNFELFSWSLPPRWQIVATANPDDADYSVTPMDDAMLTRMIHLTMRFDPKAWAVWASANGIDRRCIDFLLLYPEANTGKLTTPRSLEKFFRLVGGISDFAERRELVTRLGTSCLDEITVSSFLACALDELPRLVAPEAILKAQNLAPVMAELENLVFEDGSLRVDRMSVMLTRIYLALINSYVDLEEVRKENLVAFLLIDCMPADLRMMFWKDIVATGRPELKALLQDPRLISAILGS